MVAANLPRPIPQGFLDAQSKTRNQKITSNSVAKISGSKLKFNADNLEEGVFIIDNNTKASTRVEVILDNKPKSISFLVPSLTASKVTIEVRSRMMQNVKQLRIGASGVLLDVMST